MTGDPDKLSWNNNGVTTRLAAAMGTFPVPEGLSWDLFLGVAAELFEAERAVGPGEDVDAAIDCRRRWTREHLPCWVEARRHGNRAYEWPVRCRRGFSGDGRRRTRQTLH